MCIEIEAVSIQAYVQILSYQATRAALDHAIVITRDSLLSTVGKSS